MRRFGRDVGARAWFVDGCGTMVLVALIGPFVAALFGFLIWLVAFLAMTAGPTAAVPMAIILGLWTLLLAGGVVSAHLSTREANERRYRLERFARANGLDYERAPRVDYRQPVLADKPGMLFSRGWARHTEDVVRRDGAVPVEIGNLRYRTGPQRLPRTHRWGYLALRLDTPLPHIVLDAAGNNGLASSNLPVGFRADQRLRLEGDFDRVFRLYCPTGYERDALYLFTPDIMARFIDTAAELDVEIVDDWVFFYRKQDLSTLDPATWEWLGSVEAAVSGKLAQWERWRDGRAEAGAGAAIPLLRPPRGVAAPGRRLRRSLPWAAIALVIASVATLYWALGAANL